MGVESIVDDDVVAELHRPGGDPRATVVLAHGAGGNRNTVILRALATEMCGRGLAVARIDLPYRQRRPKGPPSPAAAVADRDGIRAACRRFACVSSGPMIVGGHSYGGRQVSMVVAEEPSVADILLLTSYPLHPPGKPDRLRTDHLPSITTPTIVVHGRSDPFATSDELAQAISLIPTDTVLVEIDGAGHDLKPDRPPSASLTADAVDTMLANRNP